MGLKNFVRKNTYYDSVTLMLISKEIKDQEYVTEVLVGMATELNVELAENLDLMNDEIKDLTANDFFIVAKLTDDEKMELVVQMVDDLLNQKKANMEDDYMPKTFNSAMSHIGDANMTLISLPGKYAAIEAKKSLENGIHVMLFSDNVSVKEEKELKELAVQNGLLMMGPDCGTAIINGKPLAFANVVKTGDIGIVAASGTGLQEVSVTIDKLGKGISQAIGTGGRDLKEEIGGLMMKQGFKALMDDPETNVIVLISKPPGEQVAREVLDMVKLTSKPVVVNFIGGDAKMIEDAGAYPCVTLEDTAYKAVALSFGGIPIVFDGFTLSEEEIGEIVDKEVSKYADSQKYFRGLYTGGTLADEAMKMLGKIDEEIYSNIPLDPKYALKDVNSSLKNTCIDLGDDMFTVGRPHPMIDPSVRTDRLLKEMDDDVAILLMDVVLGYGSHADPAGELIQPIKEAKEKMKKGGKHLTVVCSICGTEGDYQSLDKSREVLEKAGVIVMPTNAQAVRLTSRILEKLV